MASKQTLSCAILRHRTSVYTASSQGSPGYSLLTTSQGYLLSVMALCLSEDIGQSGEEHFKCFDAFWTFTPIYTIVPHYLKNPCAQDHEFYNNLRGFSD